MFEWKKKKYEKAETYLEVIILLGNVCVYVCCFAIDYYITYYTVDFISCTQSQEHRNVGHIHSSVTNLHLRILSLLSSHTLTMYFHCHFLLFNKHIYIHKIS